MSLEAEVLVDRRKLQRRLSVWRIAAIALGLGLFIAAIANSAGGADLFGGSAQIARINISGVITDDKEQQAMLRKLAKSKHVEAVIMHVNSPGGTTTGGEALYEEIRALNNNKPVVAVFGTMATSAAYIAGLGTDHIVARGNSITGSVGVIFQFPNFTELLEKVGVKMEVIKSGPLKATPSPYEHTDEASRQLAQDMVDEGQQWFLRLVKERRKLSTTDLENVKDGRIFSGRQAKTKGLIDALGGESKALDWLKEKHKIDVNLPIKDWEPARKDEFGFLGIRSGISKLLGWSTDPILELIKNTPALERLRLDGMISIWQPISKS